MDSVQFPIQIPEQEDDAACKRKPPPKRELVPKVKSMVLTPDKKLMTALLRCFLFFEGFSHNGWNHVNNVYYVVLAGWSPFKASWIWFARDIVRILTLAPAGAMIDKTKHKKWILVLVGLQKIFGGFIMIYTDNYIAHIFKGISDGFTEAFIAPTVAAMTLGVVGKTRFHKKALAYNEMIKNSGTILSILIFGSVAYGIFNKNFRNMFYHYVAVGIVLLATVAAMPSETSDVVDHRRAAGRSRRRSIERIAELFDIADDSDDEDGAPEEIKTDSNEKVENKAHPTLSRLESQKYTKTMTLREMFNDPARGRSMLFLAFVICTFHLVNATVLPLTGQFVGFEVENRHSLPLFMFFLLIKIGGETLSQGFLVGRMDVWGYRNCMIAACVLLGVRCALFAAVSSITRNVWILAVVHMTQGPPTALEGLTKRLYVHVLSRQTGRYNLNFGIIETFKVIGSALSITIGGALATVYSYQVVFIFLAAMCIFPICLIFGVNDLSLTNPLDVKNTSYEKLETEDGKVVGN